MKNKFKNLIYFVLLLVIVMPEGAAIAQGRQNKVSNNIVKKVEIKIVTKVETPKEIVIEEKKPEVPAVPVQTQNGYIVYSIDEIKAKICAVFGKDCQNALIIAFRESGFGQFRISKTNDYGIFQMNCRWQKRRVGGDCTKFFDVDTNIRIAKQIFDEQGWNPWTTKIYLPK